MRKSMQEREFVDAVEQRVGGDTAIIGVLVDSVNEVFKIDSSQIEPPPGFGMRADSGFIRGMAKLEENFTIILDINRIFDISELLHITNGERPEDIVEQTL